MLLLLVLIAFECWFIPYLGVIPTRFKTFTGEILKQFSDEHKKAFGTTKVPRGGFPDCGEGRYSEKLPFKQWFTFNCAQRGHLNFVEHLPIALTLFLITGLTFPRWTAVLSVFYMIGRIIYARGYLKGPSGRRLGAHIADYILLI